MRFGPVMLGVCAVLVCVCTARPSTPKSQAANVATSTPLILEKNEGERRVLRGCLDILSRERLSLSRSIQRMADPRIWSFSQETSRPEEQSTHIATQTLTKFSFCKSGTARMHLGDSVRDIHAGSTVFIPANTWISVDNIGNDNISMVSVFSAPGFEEFMRAGSVREGEKNVPLAEAENDQIEKAHLSDVIYKEP
jgi:mannose-6-phosphate isomerase-like protein (cupin superfamily)